MNDIHEATDWLIRGVEAEKERKAAERAEKLRTRDSRNKSLQDAMADALGDVWQHGAIDICDVTKRVLARIPITHDLPQAKGGIIEIPGGTATITKSGTADHVVLWTEKDGVRYDVTVPVYERRQGTPEPDFITFDSTCFEAGCDVTLHSLRIMIW